MVLAGDFNYDRDRIKFRSEFEQRDRWYDKQTEADVHRLFPSSAELYQPECAGSDGLDTDRRSIAKLDRIFTGLAYDELPMLHVSSNRFYHPMSDGCRLSAHVPVRARFQRRGLVQSPFPKPIPAWACKHPGVAQH